MEKVRLNVTEFGYGTSDFYAIIHEKNSCIYFQPSTMISRRLPPLKSLVYFEAAARLQSFTRASAELNVTQGAVSRQVRQLETFLGRILFKRDKRQVFLNDDGHNYYLSIAHLLHQLHDVTESLLAPAQSDQVSMVTSSALACMYLLPKIPAFRQAFSHIQIRIVARDNIAQLSHFDFDLALYYCRNPPTEYDYTQLFHEEIFPVCSPDYLKSNPDQFASHQGLSNNVIWMETDEDWINWPEWLKTLGLEIKTFNNRLVVNHYPMVIQAAIAGQGVALAWARLVETELERGTLVRPTNLSLVTGSGFYLISPKNNPETEFTNIFKIWLKTNQ